MPVGRRTIKSMKCLCNRPISLHTNKGHEMVVFMKVITTILMSVAIVLGSCVVGATPAGADEVTIDPNPFGALSSGPRETALTGGPAVREEIERGIRGGLSASPESLSLD